MSYNKNLQWGGVGIVVLAEVDWNELQLLEVLLYVYWLYIHMVINVYITSFLFKNVVARDFFNMQGAKSNSDTPTKVQIHSLELGDSLCDQGRCISKMCSNMWQQAKWLD